MSRPTVRPDTIDRGVYGIIFPHIDDANAARSAARQLRFEPDGTRGMGPTSRAGAWGLHGSAAYLDAANRPLAIAILQVGFGTGPHRGVLVAVVVVVILLGEAEVDEGAMPGITEGHSK